MQRRSFLFLPFLHRPYATLTGIRFRVLRYRRSNRRYVQIHGNESTAHELLATWMYTHPGIAYLRTGTTRNVELMGGQLDPNRMYSRTGAQRNLRRLNPNWSTAQITEALDYLDRRREQLIRKLTPPPGGVLIALHNNSEGYNVNEELADSDRASIKQPTRPHEFFLCTDPADFDRVAASPYNVVLQNRKPAEDDGSLSRLAAARGFRYVNLETTLGHYEAQIERLNWLEQNLP